MEMSKFSIQGACQATCSHAGGYNQKIKSNSEFSRKTTLILTVALAAIALTGIGDAFKVSPRIAAVIAPLAFSYVQASILLHLLKLKPADKVEEREAFSRKNVVHDGLVLSTVLAAAGVFLQQSARFAALFALLAAGTGAALWHKQGLTITPVKD